MQFKMKRRAAYRAISAENSRDSDDCNIAYNSEILCLIIRYANFAAVATFGRGQTTLFARRKLEIITYRCAPRREAHRDGVARKKGGDNMALHQVKELGWVSFWVAFFIFLFAFFIPTVNRSLNL
jgi:hypothetical protein